MGDWEDNVAKVQAAATQMEESAEALIRPENIEELAQWWETLQERELPEVMRKAELYGSEDLKLMGAAMQALVPGLDEAGGLQAAVAFYSLGKIARAMSALAEGRSPQGDDWYDLSVYARMALKIQETGKWT